MGECKKKYYYLHQMIYDLHYSNPHIVIWYEQKKGHGMYQSAFQELLMTV